ncbi:MAG: hypothetical protein WCO60_10255 [Verrucomicrobiota bacterium]
MRIPNLTVSDAVVNRLNVLRGKQNKLNEELATGQRITFASEDPEAASRTMNLRSQVAITQQYARNANLALGISESTSSALASLNDLSDRAGELAAMAGSGVASVQERSAYAVELNQIIIQAIESGNSQFNGQYLFNGTNTATAPFGPDATGTNAATGQPNTADHPGGVTSTLPADPTTGNGLDIQLSDTLKISPYNRGANNAKLPTFINNLIALRDAMERNDTSAISAARTGLKTSEVDIVNSIAEVGAGRARLQSIQTAAETRFSDLNTLINSETDVDIAQSMVDLTKVQTAYQAALQAGGEVLKMSLLDYIR